MKILAFDLSSRQGSMAFCETSAPSRCLAQRQWPNDRRNSAPFFQTLDEIIRAYGVPESILVGLGPGSYTGTRIAISAAIGLQVISGAQLCGLPSICAMSEKDDYIVIGDAKRASFFFAHVKQGRIEGEIVLLSENEIGQRIAQTTTPVFSADELPQFERVQPSFPRAELLCRLAEKSKNLVHAPLEPIYLRPPHITAPAHK